MGKTFRRSEGDWDDEYGVEVTPKGAVKQARKANKIIRKERHRHEEFLELNDRVDDGDR